MYACLIPPTADLERFVDRSCTHHLLLAHLMDDDRYVEFYNARSRLYNDFLIMDNGAKELGKGLHLKDVLELAARVKASEVVVQDVKFKRHETVECAVESLEWLLTVDGRRRYEAAGQPKLMFVPQGESLREWEACLYSLTRLAEHMLDPIPNAPVPTIGCAYHYDRIFGSMMPLVGHNLLESYDVHMLGLPRRMEAVTEIAETFPGRVRSLDSCKPFVYAMMGRANGAVNYPGRPEDYFERSIPRELEHIAKVNIEHFRKLVRDPGANWPAKMEVLDV